jgi:hypothetical protein
VIVAQEPDKQPLDQILLTDDHLLDLAPDARQHGALFLDLLSYLFYVYSHRSNISFLFSYEPGDPRRSGSSYGQSCESLIEPPV